MIIYKFPPPLIHLDVFLIRIKLTGHQILKQTDYDSNNSINFMMKYEQNPSYF